MPSDLALRLVRGIRTAARKKIGLPPRALIETIRVHAAVKALKKLFPRVVSWHLVGSRLRHREARDLDFVAVVRSLRDMPGRNIATRIADYGVNIFFALPEERDFTIIEFGLGLDIMRWKRAAIRKGLKLNRFGLWKGDVRVARSIEEVAAILGMPAKPHLLWSRDHPL